MKVFLIIQLMAVMCATLAFGQPVAKALPAAHIDDAWTFNLSDSYGKSHSPDEWRESKAVALLFIGADCPISNAYAPEINRVVTANSGKPIKFYLIHSDPDMTAEAARKYAVDYGYHFTALLDPTQVLAKRFGVTITPTAVVLSPQGDLLYKGRIDNRYIDLGKQRDTVTVRDLRDALAATLAGKPVAAQFTKPIGCFLPPAGH